MLSDGRVRLRAWTAADAPWYARESGDELIQRYTSEPAGLTAERLVEAIERVNQDPLVSSFAITDAHSGQLLGNIGVRCVDRVGSVYYWVAAAARGTGVATAALRLLVAWAFATQEVDELRLWTRADNTASQAVARRIGFDRDPTGDRRQEIKGTVWDTVAYVQHCPK